jgi:hypothetical protein
MLLSLWESFDRQQRRMEVYAAQITVMDAVMDAGIGRIIHTLPLLQV